MATPFTSDQPFKENNVINESERSVDPADDAGKLVQLESDGRFSSKFMSGGILDTFELTTSGTFIKPTFGQIAFVYVWGAGGGGGAFRLSTNNTSYAKGGAGGAIITLIIPIYLLPNTVSYTIGAGGNGGFVDTDFTAQDGSSGGNTSFGDFITVIGAPGGASEVGASATSGTPGISTNSSVLGFQPSQILAGGDGGSPNTGSGSNAENAPDTTYVGAGGGAAQYSTTSSNSVSLGGSSSRLAASGGDGATASSGAVTAGNGEKGCGGGAVGGFNSSTTTATAGDGGDGYIYIEIY